MNTFIVVLCVTIAVASAYYNRGYDDYRFGSRYGSYQPGLRKVADGLAAPYNNAYRQQVVNHRAERVGASSGTARYYGVPGTGLSFGYHSSNRHGNNYGYDRHGSDSYGYRREYNRYDDRIY